MSLRSSPQIGFGIAEQPVIAFEIRRRKGTRLTAVPGGRPTGDSSGPERPLDSEPGRRGEITDSPLLLQKCQVILAHYRTSVNPGSTRTLVHLSDPVYSSLRTLVTVSWSRGLTGELSCCLIESGRAFLSVGARPRIRVTFERHCAVVPGTMASTESQVRL